MKEYCTQRVTASSNFLSHWTRGNNILTKILGDHMPNELYIYFTISQNIFGKGFQKSWQSTSDLHWFYLLRSVQKRSPFLYKDVESFEKQFRIKLELFLESVLNCSKRDRYRISKNCDCVFHFKIWKHNWL